MLFWTRTRQRLVVLGCVLVLLVGSMVPPAEAAGPLVTVLLRKAANFALSYLATEVVDLATGRSFHQQLKDSIPELIKQVAAAVGPERDTLQEQLNLVQEQSRILSAILERQDEQAVDLEALRADQQMVLQRLDALEARVARLEGRVDDLEGRVDDMDRRLTQVEEARISDCLDRRHSPTIGAEGFLVDRASTSVLVDESEHPEIQVSARLYLNACTSDLTQRGLLIQLSLLTRGLDKDLRLYATFNDVAALVAGRGAQASSQRFEFPLARPFYELDAQVQEHFLPYSRIPYLEPPGPLALALVLTHDGQVRYSLPARPVSCIFGQRINCRWGR